MSTLEARVATSLQLPVPQVTATLSLLDEGNTVPFVARYRKERTGNLDETWIRAIEAAADRLRKLDQRREAIEASLREQGVFTPADRRPSRRCALGWR